MYKDHQVNAATLVIVAIEEIVVNRVISYGERFFQSANEKENFCL